MESGRPASRCWTGAEREALVLITGLGNTAHVFWMILPISSSIDSTSSGSRARVLGDPASLRRASDIATRARDDIKVLDSSKIHDAVFVGRF